MTRFKQTASGMTLAAALAALPMVAVAQQSMQSEAGQAVGSATQETKQAAGAAAEATGDAAQQAGQTLENAAEATGQAAQQAGEKLENAAEATGQTIGQAARETEQAVENAGAAAGQRAEQAGEAVEAEVIVIQGETEAGAAQGEASLATTGVAGEVPGMIRMQDENSILTSDLVGATVFNPAAEEVGEINDAIVSLEGRVEGVVIGVGGFLGLGEKRVAIEMQQLTVQTDENGRPQLFLDTTKEALEAAPEFVTAEDQRAEAVQTNQAAPAEGGTVTLSPPADPAGSPNTTVKN